MKVIVTKKADTSLLILPSEPRSDLNARGEESGWIDTLWLMQWFFI